MTGRSWSLREAQLMTVSSGYRWGARWSMPRRRDSRRRRPATWSGWTGICERWPERSLAARVPPHTVVPLMEEAGIVPVQIRRGLIAGRILSSVLSLAPEDPLRLVAELDPRPRPIWDRGLSEHPPRWIDSWLTLNRQSTQPGSVVTARRKGASPAEEEGRWSSSDPWSAGRSVSSLAVSSPVLAPRSWLFERR